MKRSERIACISKRLTDFPNKIFSLNDFSRELGASKSSISEDIDILRGALQKADMGQIETIIGASGGVVYRPSMPKQELYQGLKSLQTDLADEKRRILDDYLYYGDLLSHPEKLKLLGMTFIRLLNNNLVDGVLSIETKGVPLALAVAELLHVPAIIARKSNRVSEGNTISVHYKSITKNTLSSMYVTKGAITRNMRLLLVDDFMRAGGTMKGLALLARECEAEIVGFGVFIREQGYQAELPVLSIFNYQMGKDEQPIRLSPECQQLFNIP